MGALKGGSPDDMADSLALEIEQAMNEFLLADGLPALPTDESDITRERRRLFAAIGRGVVRHLVARRQSFEIDVDTSANDVFRHPDLTSD
ncbi:hypothetical protein FK498_02900 [Elioraea sp. Yellowstone]|jgi:hypothetical protein|uniref:hypothetical protein n=1 Tax=Elioraea sp. Yellowstone TaxID=2592070 RepID=UPI00114EB54E|nr:hypothetical protein [Elioraea sp. Yellowstone]TQF83423.1 hypothetical protein FK498_02900 [Elioraea sp. Yellowstone]